MPSLQIQQQQVLGEKEARPLLGALTIKPVPTREDEQRRTMTNQMSQGHWITKLQQGLVTQNQASMFSYFVTYMSKSILIFPEIYNNAILI